MPKVVEINVKPREKATKSEVKKNRKKGPVPSIVYGPEVESVKLWVSVRELRSKLREFRGETVFLKLVCQENKNIDGKMVLLKDAQYDPVTREVIHIDFYEFQRGREMEMEIPVHVVGDPVGVRRGGIVDWVKRSVWVKCLPKDLPEHIEVDISSLDVGDVIHVGDLPYPDGVKPAEDEELPVVAVVAEVEEAVEEEIPEEEAEPEVVARGKEEEKKEEGEKGSEG